MSIFSFLLHASSSFNWNRFCLAKASKTRHIENLHPTRDRRKSFGSIQIDGSIHLWFGSSHYLHAAIDDSTSTVVGAYFDKEETLRGYYLMFKQILTKYGIPQNFTTGRRYWLSTSWWEEGAWKTPLLSFMICRQLGVGSCNIHLQAKGRVERLFNTLQDRSFLRWA